MPALFHVKVNPETSKLVQLALFNKGFSWVNSIGANIAYADKMYLYPWKDKSICHSDRSDKDVPELTIDQFINWVNTDNLPEKAVEFRVNDNYTAIITRSKMVVGCQTISSDTALKLAKLIIKVMEE